MRRTIGWLLVPALAGAVLITQPAAATDPVRCYPGSEVFRDQVTELIGLVDGDRVPDLVRTRVRWADAQTCRARLVVRLADDVVRRDVAATLGILIGPPGLAGLVDLDRRPGLEIAVVTWRGASTGFVELYGLRRDRLILLSTESFEYGGSIVHLEGVDCVRHRGTLLVRSSAEYLIPVDRYRVERRFYAFRGGALRPVPRLTEHASVRPDRLGRFPEILAGVPFPSCTTVAGMA